MAKRSLLSKIGVITFALTIAFAAFAKDDVGTMSGGGPSVSWNVKVTGHDAVKLTILDADGNAIVKSFSAGKNPTFNIADLGGIVADGQYNYQLTVEPRVSASVKKQLSEARAQNDEAAIRKLQKANGLDRAVTQSGVITIVNNSIISPDAGPEPGANDSVSSAISGSSSETHVATGRFQVSTNAVPAAGKVTALDQVIPDDLIVQGSTCTGFDCVDNESFGFDTLRLKENNLRIHFDDTSASAGYPANDWRIIANDSASGGANKFVVEDSTAARNPFTIEAASPANSLYVDSTGNIGMQQSTPLLDLHMTETDTPAIRLEQTNGGGFTAQTWDIGANEANFFVRDLTGGSRLSFRIRPGAPTSSIDISSSGKVGIGTASPDSQLHVVGDGTLLKMQNTVANNSFTGIAFYENISGVATEKALINVLGSTSGAGSGANGFQLWNSANGAMTFGTNNSERMRITNTGSVGIGVSVPLSKLHVSGGDIRVSTGSFIDDGTTLNVPDYVFEDSYKLMPITELKNFIAENKHLPNVPNVDDVKANGVNLSQFQMRLLEKVEELTLYTVAQHDQNQELQKRIAALEEQLAKKQ
jgi:hypothetical protein